MGSCGQGPNLAPYSSDNPPSTTIVCPVMCRADPEDVAHVVSFLCSESARHITGQTIVVDGGLSLE